MTSIHPSLLVEGLYATYDLLTTLILCDSSGELQDPTNRLVDRAMAYVTEVVSTEKNKIMTNSRNNVIADICMNGQMLEKVISFKCLGTTLCKCGTCLAETCVRIASAMAVVARLGGSGSATPSVLQTSSSCTSLVMSILLYGCKTWTLLADLEKKRKKKKDPGFQNQVPGETCLHLLLGAQDHRLGVEQDKVPCGSTRTSSGNCQETEIDLHHMHVCVCVCVCECV